MTPEQQKKADEFLKGWDEDYGFYANHIATERGISRTEALTYVMALQFAAMRDAFDRSQHPQFNPECPHCVAQKEHQDVVARYMERAIKHMDECEHEDDGWKPL